MSEMLLRTEDVCTRVEEAAATAVGMATGGSGCGPPHPLKTITLRLDHSFLFFVRDLQTGAILSMGRVLDPSTRG